MTLRKVACALLGSLVFACVNERAQAPTSGASTAPREARKQPVVVVTLVVDQLAAWIASERFPLLPDSGGFARLRREGTWVREMRYDHAVTDTAPGHAALYTGATPRASGIFANEVVDEITRKRRSILRDPLTRALRSDGQRGADHGPSDDAPSSSSARFRVDTVADALRAAHPDAVIVSLSLKDRAAIPGGGRHPTSTLWIESPYEGFLTSTAFAASFPAWARPIADKAALDNVRSQRWDLRDPKWAPSHSITPDAQPGEGDFEGAGITFPHGFTGGPGAFRESPFADEMLLGLGLAAVDAQFAKGHAMLLAISLSTNDYVGHSFGPDSWEAWDELLRLDAALAKFFTGLDARFGSDGYAVVLSADHGVTTMPEVTLLPGARPWCEPDAKPDRWERACGKVGRLLSDALADEIRVAVRAGLGEGDFIAGIADPYVYLTRFGRALAGEQRKKLDLAVTSALAKHPEVDEVFARDAVPPSNALVFNSVPDVAGDYYVLVSRGSFFDPLYVLGTGTSHGSPYLYDRAVPLLVRAPGRVAAGVVNEGPLDFRTFARAATDLLEIPPLDSVTNAPALVGKKRKP